MTNALVFGLVGVALVGGVVIGFLAAFLIFRGRRDADAVRPGPEIGRPGAEIGPPVPLPEPGGFPVPEPADVPVTEPAYVPAPVVDPEPVPPADEPDEVAPVPPPQRTIVAAEAVLVPQAVLLAGEATDRDAAIDEAGGLLVATGAVEDGYVESMRVRENSVSTFMGSQLAIPHGTTAAKVLIRRSAVAVVRYPEPILWHGNRVKFVVAIAGAGDDHLKLVSKVAEVFLDERAVAGLDSAETSDEVLRVFAGLNG